MRITRIIPVPNSLSADAPVKLSRVEKKIIVQ